MFNMIQIRQLLFIQIIGALFFLSCQSKLKTKKLPLGTWKGELALNEKDILPFLFELDSERMTLLNGEERIVIDELKFSGDSFSVKMLHFDTEIKAQFNEEKISGSFIKNYREQYSIPFSATQSNKRYEAKNDPESDISGNWEVRFSDYEESGEPAMGIFKEENGLVTGTFLTITGDYRFLEGVLDGTTLKLSTFDGEHAFLFQAQVSGNEMRGKFLSGTHWTEDWVAFRNDTISLSSPLELSKSIFPDSSVRMSFPNEQGVQISLEDDSYKGRPVILQILGTWCPNCMDESIFLGKWHANKEATDPEIIGLAFERKDDLAYASERIKKMKSKLGVGYEVLFAGYYKKDSATAILGFLNKVISYPTLVFLDEDHIITSIHTGFSGPGTGIHYDRFKSLFDRLVEENKK